jgi:hypothetical protein
VRGATSQAALIFMFRVTLGSLANSSVFLAIMCYALIRVFFKFLEHGLNLRLLFDQIGASLCNAFGLLNEFLTHPFELCDILDAL